MTCQCLGHAQTANDSEPCAKKTYLQVSRISFFRNLLAIEGLLLDWVFINMLQICGTSHTYLNSLWKMYLSITENMSQKFCFHKDNIQTLLRKEIYIVDILLRLGVTKSNKNEISLNNFEAKINRTLDIVSSSKITKT